MVKIIEVKSPPLSDPIWHEPPMRWSPPLVRKAPKEEKADRHDDATEKPPAPPPPGKTAE